MKITYEKEIEARKIVVSARPVWKCRACPMYGKTPSCPPYAPSWKETQEWLTFFKKGLLLKFEIEMNTFEAEKRRVLLCLLKKEKKYFNEGYPYALALFPGNCNLCDECEFEKSKECIDPTRVRPCVDAVGIEVSSLVKIAFSENVLYGLVLID